MVARSTLKFDCGFRVSSLGLSWSKGVLLKRQIAETGMKDLYLVSKLKYSIINLSGFVHGPGVWRHRRTHQLSNFATVGSFGPRQPMRVGRYVRTEVDPENDLKM